MHLVNFVIIWGIKVNLDLLSTHSESFWVELCQKLSFLYPLSAKYDKKYSYYFKMSEFSPRNVRYPRYQDTDLLQLCPGYYFSIPQFWFFIGIRWYCWFCAHYSIEGDKSGYNRNKTRLCYPRICGGCCEEWWFANSKTKSIAGSCVLYLAIIGKGRKKLEGILFPLIGIGWFLTGSYDIHGYRISQVQQYWFSDEQLNERRSKKDHCDFQYLGLQAWDQHIFPCCQFV